jgi:hypothetical protein
LPDNGREAELDSERRVFAEVGYSPLAGSLFSFAALTHRRKVLTGMLSLELSPGFACEGDI